MGVNHAKKILIVDDEPAVAQLLKMLLGSHGFSTEAVTTGREALGRLSPSIDLVLLDMVLPDLEGSQICQKIRANALTRDIPIIILTGRQDKDDRIRSLYMGADDYLVKPFEPEELVARIDVIFRRNGVVSHGAAVTEEQQVTVRELQRIVDEESLTVCFQPIYFLNPMRLFGLEVLSRPQTKGPMINPEVFFKNALRYGFYYEVEMLGWRKAVETAAAVFDGRQKLFLNCSPYLIETEKFKDIKHMFVRYGLPSEEVFLEITERSAITEFDAFYDRLLQYRHDGFKIAVDDVGGGYSSLESIVELRPEVVKLDRHIVYGVGNDPFKRSIIKLIVAFCRENGIICVAEGIENKNDLNILVELGVDAGQGYYLFRPTPNVDLRAMQALQL